MRCNLTVIERFCQCEYVRVCANVFVLIMARAYRLLYRSVLVDTIHVIFVHGHSTACVLLSCTAGYTIRM